MRNGGGAFLALVLFVWWQAPAAAGPVATNTCTQSCNGLDSASVITGSFICRDGSGNLVVDGMSQGLYVPGTVVLGTIDDDVVILPETDDVVYTGGGNDTICTDGGNDLIAADDPTSAAGTDWVDAGEGDDQVFTGNSDTPGTGADDVVLGGGGNDFIFTGNGYDSVTAGTGNNVVCSNGGDDTITTGAGIDTVIAGEGIDTISTDEGADLVLGGAGDSNIATGGADDLVVTGTGNDTVDCGNGAVDGSADAGGSDSINDCELQNPGHSAVCGWKYVVASGFPGPAPFTFRLTHQATNVIHDSSTLDGKGGGVLFTGLFGGVWTLSESVNHTYTPFVDCVDVTPPIIAEAVPRTFGSTTNTFSIGGIDNNPHPFDDNPHCVVYNVGPQFSPTPSSTPTPSPTATSSPTPTTTATSSATVTASPSATSFAAPPNAPAIPTLSAIGAAILVLLLLGLGVTVLARRG
jgi:Ca2+-binding RTX toxin-like protein